MLNIIEKEDALSVLSEKLMTLDGWNRVQYLSSPLLTPIQILPEKYEGQTYSFACNLADWVDANNCAYIFISDSTQPIREEGFVFFKTIGRMSKVPNLAVKNIFYVSASDFDSKSEYFSTLSLLIYFCILFEWHVNFVGDGTKKLSINDGVIYLYSNSMSDDSISVIDAIQQGKFGLSKWQTDQELWEVALALNK